MTWPPCFVRLAAVLWLATTAALCYSGDAQVGSAEAKAIAIPDQRDSDLRMFGHGGEVIYGVRALEKMEMGDALVIWLAGNQFFAMENVVRAFQKQHAELDVGVVTLPPGLLLSAIQAGGLAYDEKIFHRPPDVYGSVTPVHLRQTNRIGSYVSYAHNRLELIVAAGNPRAVRDLHDLARSDLKVTLPNPINEGIMQVYAKPILIRLGLWGLLSSGQDCMDCDPTPRVHFTRVHHREIPERIRAGATDVGLVWHTEGIAAREQGGIDAVSLPSDQSAVQDVTYVAGALENGSQRAAADAYVEFLISAEGQAAYGRFGFVPASASERHIEPLPPG